MAKKPNGKPALVPVAASEPQQLQIADIDLRNYTKIDAPIFGVSTIQGTGNDFTVCLTQPRPMNDDQAKSLAPFALAETIAILRLSPGTLKDLAILFTETIGRHEKQFGIVNTPFTKAREAKGGRRQKGR
jgi:hypothetical protein